MPDPHIVVNMSEAVAERVHPAITRWNRLEGRPRAHNFDRAMKAEVRDALWMLARQWQMGEFQGDDAGSPVLARACVDLATIDRFQARQGPVETLALEEPLEAKVERRPLPLWAGPQYLSLDIRLVVGRRWLKLLASEATRPGGLSADYREAYIGRYSVQAPNPATEADAAICAHPDVWQQVGAAAERAMDGIALLEHIANPANDVFDGVGAAADDEPKLTTLGERLQTWFASLIMQPAEASDAWVPSRLEYQFGCSAQEGGGENGPSELVMRAEEYFHGHLDWYALERRPDEIRLGPGAVPVKQPERRVHTFIPTTIAFEGMPNTRWWAFEDHRTNFGEISPDTTDLGKLLLMEFGLVYANDWFVLPYTMPIGRVADVKGIAISNVFGERFWIEPVRDQTGDGWNNWSLFTLSRASVERQPPPARLVLLPTAPKVQESAALEEVALIRDEMANMVWAMEGRVHLPSGASRPGREAAREFRQYLQRLIETPAGPTFEPKAPIRYQVMNTVPEQWIPFIPVHVDGSVRETQLQRAAMPRILEGDTRSPRKVRPRTTLLRHGLPKAYFIHEEEVPRAGALVRQSYQRTRWIGGRVFTWFGARKQTGRGEGSSGLRFDGLTDTTS
jgi:hypothetical protein